MSGHDRTDEDGGSTSSLSTEAYERIGGQWDSAAPTLLFLEDDDSAAPRYQTWLSDYDVTHTTDVDAVAEFVDSGGDIVFLNEPLQPQYEQRVEASSDAFQRQYRVGVSSRTRRLHHRFAADTIRISSNHYSERNYTQRSPT